MRNIVKTFGSTRALDGLDPLMETVFQSTIAEIAKEGRTVLLSSHILAELESLCDRVTIILHGKVVQQGTLDDLRTTTRTSISVAATQPIEGLDDIDGVHAIRQGDAHLHFEVESSGIDRVMRHIAQFGIESLTSQPPTLTELFLREYGDDVGTIPSPTEIAAELVH